jgi:hypothetical protein
MINVRNRHPKALPKWWWSATNHYWNVMKLPQPGFVKLSTRTLLDTSDWWFQVVSSQFLVETTNQLYKDIKQSATQTPSLLDSVSRQLEYVNQMDQYVQPLLTKEDFIKNAMSLLHFCENHQAIYHGNVKNHPWCRRPCWKFQSSRLVGLSKDILIITCDTC